MEYWVFSTYIIHYLNLKQAARDVPPPPPVVFFVLELSFLTLSLWIFVTLMNRNLKEVLYKNFFSMHRVGYRAVKSPSVKRQKTKIAHYFFVTKATDLKTFFINDCRYICHTFFTLFWPFLPFKNWTMNMHFNPIPIL